MTDLRKETYTMPAARLGPDNPLPALYFPRKRRNKVKTVTLPTTGTILPWTVDKGFLPYLVQDSYDRRRSERAFASLVLENNILKATFLPELGGRLWSLYDKVAGRELLYVNPVFQPVNFALRNAWFSGGVEWNVGMMGHSAFTCSPVFAAQAKTAAGRPVLRLYEWERIRQVAFQLDFILPEDSPFLMVWVRIINPHPTPVPMYWWSNIAVPERERQRVIVPAQYTYFHDYSGALQLSPIPVREGVDITYSTNSRGAADFFYNIPEGQQPWITALDRDGRGLLHSSTGLLLGRKLFVWGTQEGSRHWQEFLSGPGEAYMELQAGLARTQGEYPLLPPGSETCWLETYGLCEADPKIVHGPDWQKAVKHINDIVQELVPLSRLEVHLEEHRTTADRPPSEILHYGSGWGALERLRREAAKEPAFCSPGLVFPYESLGSEQEIWVSLVKKSVFPDEGPQNGPGAWVVQAEWLGLLEKAAANTKNDHWLSWLHLGVMYCYQGRPDDAKAAWNKSVTLKPSAWAYRNLALIAQHEGDLAEAARLYGQAHTMQPDLMPLLVECCRVLVAAGSYREMLGLVAGMPEVIRRNGRIQTLEAQAVLGLGDLEKAGQILGADITMADIREGETILTELWFRMQEKRIAQAENIPVNDTLRERVEKECPPPRWLDFRMQAKQP